MIKLKCNGCDGACDDELDIRFGTSCDNNCPFCIEKNHGKPPAELNPDKILKNLIELNDHKKCINIVGGEPLLYIDKLLDFIPKLRKANVCDQICIVTSLPKVSDENKLYQLIELVDDFIVSFQHYDPKLNNELMHASNNYDRIAEFESLCNLYNAKLSVTLNISQSGINNEYDLIEALKLFNSFNVKNVRLNELDSYSEWIALSEIVPKLKLKSAYAHGCSVDVTKFFRKRYKLTIPKIKCRLRCFHLEPRTTASFADFLKVYIKYKQRIKEAKKGIKEHKYERNRVTVMYEDGSTAFFWKKFK